LLCVSIFLDANEIALEAIRHDTFTQQLEADMTFKWIDNGGLPRRPARPLRFERRIDERTAADIADALRARGVQAAALAMDHLQVDMDVALRVLAGASTRRGSLLALPSACRRQRQRQADRTTVQADPADEFASV
jgi:hypothetical protein